VNVGDIPQHSRPLWIASLVTPAVTLAAWFAVLCAVEFARSGSIPGEMVRLLALLVLVGLPVAFGAMFLLCLPLLLLMRSQGMLTGRNVGIVSIAVATIALVGFFSIALRQRLDVQLVPWCLGLGLFSAAVFCLVAGIPFRGRTS
jgi:hypothetical protein